MDVLGSLNRSPAEQRSILQYFGRKEIIGSNDFQGFILLSQGYASDRIRRRQ
jgi:hypothetical protein